MALKNQQSLRHSTESSTVADLLERILDKGIVITGDIKIKLVDIELLSLEIRLVICSVDKAVELGMDWWKKNPAFQSIEQQTKPVELPADSQHSLRQINERLAMLENKIIG